MLDPIHNLRPVDGKAMRQALIDAKLLRPAASSTQPTATRSHLTGVYRLDDTGKAEASRCIARGRDRHFDRNHDARVDL